MAMAAKLPEILADDPAILSQKDEGGWTALHHEALAGNAAIVKILLDAGADRNARTNQVMTPLQLARSLGWESVVELLVSP